MAPDSFSSKFWLGIDLGKGSDYESGHCMSETGKQTAVSYIGAIVVAMYPDDCLTGAGSGELAD